MKALLAAARAGEWWEYKLAPILGTGFATAVFARLSILHVLGQIALVLAGLVPGAIYVSVLNDITDLRVDAQGGKANRMAGRSGLARGLALGVPIAAGAAIAVLAWRQQPLLLGLYAAAWLAFALYSAPGPRLKARGAAGAVADAVGAHLFPNLLMVAAVLSAGGRAFALDWGLAVGVWSAACGLRFAIWHQLRDAAVDARTGVRTFGSHRPDQARWVGRWLAFPSELIAFGLMLILARGVIAAILLALYAVLEVRRTRRWGARIVVVGSAERYRLVMLEYYVTFYPLAFLAAGVLRHQNDVAALGLVLVLAPRVAGRVIADSLRELRTAIPRAPVRAR